MSEQITFATSDFASNPEPRCPCILLLDVSGSMNGRPINELNAGLVTFRDEAACRPAGLKKSGTWYCDVRPGACGTTLYQRR